MSFECSTFASKCFLADCLHVINLAKVAIVDPCMLWTCYCRLFVSQTCLLTVGCLAMPSLQRSMPCIFLISVVTCTSMQTRLRNVSDFRDLVISLKSLSAVILLSCKLDATERSMHILRYFSKDVLNICLCSIHPCPCLQLWSSLACHFLALLLL